MTDEPKTIEGEARPAGKPSKYSWNKVTKVMLIMFGIWILVTWFLGYIGFIAVKSDATLLWLLGGPGLLTWFGLIFLD